jgi:hypothetical protein
VREAGLQGLEVAVDVGEQRQAQAEYPMFGCSSIVPR